MNKYPSDPSNEDPYTATTESFGFMNPMEDYLNAAERKGIKPTPTSVVALIGQSARQLTALMRRMRSPSDSYANERYAAR